MTNSNPTAAIPSPCPPTASRPGRRPRRGMSPAAQAAAGSRDAKRVAAAILEVLGGARTPAEAAAALGISLVRYYLMETRALTGLVTGCEPPVDRRRRSADRERATLQKDLERARRECARYQALARAAQRTIGLAAPPPRPGKARPGGKHRPRPPTVRALKAAALLQSGPEPTPPATPDA